MKSGFPTLRIASRVVWLLLCLYAAAGTTHQERRLRAARPMTLAFFRKLYYAVVGKDVNDNDNSNYSEQDWEEHTESNWQRAEELETNQSKPFPFLICNDGPQISAERKQQVQQAMGVDGNLSHYLETVYNKPNVSCYMGLINGTLASDLEDWIVQPISFLMKINAGTLDFTSATHPNLQYAIYFCPGQPDLDLRDFALNALAEAVPLMDQLLQYPEAALYQDSLMRLNEILQMDPTYCNDILVDNVEAEQTGPDSVVLTLAGHSSSAAPETCFVFLAFALAYAPEICYIERRPPFETSNTVAQWISQSGIPNERPFFDKNITGHGQVVAVSDTGLDLQNCYFQDVSEMEFGTVCF